MHSALRHLIRIASIALAVLGIYWICWMPAKANRLLLLIDDDTARIEPLPDDERAAGARDHISRLEEVEPVCRRNIDYLLILAANERMAGEPERAIETYTKALSVDHRPEIYYWRGMTKLQIGRAEEAIRDFTITVSFNPRAIRRIPYTLRDRVLAASPEWARATSAARR